MSDGIAEMNKAKTYTHTDGVKYNIVDEGIEGGCDGCFFACAGGCNAEILEGVYPCGEGSVVLQRQSPLATASAELAKKGTPLVADAKPVSDIDTEQVTDPAHYAKSYPQGIEVYQMIEVILEKLGGHLTPYDQWLFGNILKYRLRAGFKDDGNDGMQDLKKAMRCREMMSD